LYSQYISKIHISDLGFCDPAGKPEKYFYIAPEVLIRKEYTFKSDVYSVGIFI